jgi:hypothetical protein
MTSSWPSALLISLGLIASTVIGSQTYFTVKSFDNSITVTGSAERTVTSDRAKWTAGFSRSTGIDDVKTGNDNLQKDLTAVKQLLKDRGISETEVTVKAPTMTPVCEGQGSMGYDQLGQNCGSNKTVGYTIQQTIIVESSEVDKVTKLSQEASGFLSNSGILFTSGSLEYYYSKLDDLKLEMLGEATNNAQSRAQKILEATHTKLGGLQNAGMGIFQVTPVNSTEVSDYGTYDTSSIEKKITAIVHASFKLQQ